MPNVKSLTKNSGKISEHFSANELASHDGITNLLFDYDLIPIIERLREYVETPITINSAYRTKKYNKKVGGALNSYHLYGRAIDIPLKKRYRNLITIDLLCNFFNTLGLKGIIKYPNVVHIDTRLNKYHATNKKVKQNYGKVKIPYRSLLKTGTKNIDVGILQFKLKSLGYYNGNADMIYGNKTQNAVKKYQKANDLKVDGIVGKNTWKKIF